MSVGEFVALMAMLMAMVALSIDMMLPALPMIGADLGAESENARQHVISVLLLGFTMGQIFYGPLSDSAGRKPALCLGTVLYLVGSLIAALSNHFDTMLLGRLLQGLGVAALRVVTVAVIRDLYQGEQMARIMSFIMSIFIIAPMLAPLLGQGILMVAHWRAIFAVLIALGIVSFVWFWLRQPETLARDRRIPINIRTLYAGMLEVARNPVTMGYTLILGLIMGAFFGFLISSQQILQETYTTGARFPLYFALLALCHGVASLTNAQIVERFGMQRLTLIATLGIVLISAAFLLNNLSVGAQASLWRFMLGIGGILFCIGFCFGNLNAMALEPVGHIAGLATSMVSFVSGGIAVALGWAIGAAYDGTVIPLFAGFLLAGLGSLVIMTSVTRGRTKVQCGECP